MAYVLDDNDVHLWYANCDDPEVLSRAPDYLALLSEDEVARYERFAFEKDRRLFLTARSLLRISLSRYAPVEPGNWAFQQTAKGKLYLNDSAEFPPLRFNVSHSGQLAVCAITLRHRIGVDIEATTRQADARVTKYFLSPQEMAHYQQASSGEKQELFYRYWTLKEAYAKALGMGLSMPFTDFSFVWDFASTDTTLTPTMEATPPKKEPNLWHFHQTCPSPHYILSVAVETGSLDPPRFVLCAEADARGR